jgi:hypothetical protein
MPLPYSVAVRTFIHSPPPFHDIASDLSHSFQEGEPSILAFHLKNTQLVLLPFEFLALEPVERKENSELQTSSPPEAQLLHRTNNTLFATLCFLGKSKQGNTNTNAKGSKGGSEYVSKSWLISMLFFGR